MKIHEYQAKEIFRKYGIPVPKGLMADSLEKAIDAAKGLGGDRFVVKAQVHAGGRGKAGGIKLVQGEKELEESVTAMLGKKLVTHQTGPKGITIRKLYIEQPADIAQSLYMAVVVNRSIKRAVITASKAGDVEIEQTASRNPELIIQEPIDPASGFFPYHGRKIAWKLGLKGEQAKQAGDIASKIYKIFDELDCTLVEINPLVLTKSGDLIAVDAKINFDDNASYRHKELKDLEDHDESEQVEMEAAEQGISYVRLDGNIGCLVNGAGLAMTTMDMVALAGGMPANFLDVGGGADKERVTKALKIILSDKNVRVIFVNIFGGIVRCPMVAEGVVDATRDLQLKLPLVVCLKGTQQEEGRKILEKSGLKINACETMAEGAKLAVELAKKAQGGAV